MKQITHTEWLTWPKEEQEKWPYEMDIEPAEDKKAYYMEVWQCQSQQDKPWFDSFSQLLDGVYNDFEHLKSGYKFIGNVRQLYRLMYAPQNEVEAETVQQAAKKHASGIARYELRSLGYDAFIAGTEWQLQQLQSTLTQKDPNIAEVEHAAQKASGEIFEGWNKGDIGHNDYFFEQGFIQGAKWTTAQLQSENERMEEENKMLLAKIQSINNSENFYPNSNLPPQQA